MTTDDIIATATAISAASAIALVLVAWLQLKNIAIVQKKWATLSACERYDTDPILEEATKTIWKCRAGPGDYSNQAEYEREIIVLLNYLDSLAVGIAQNLYIEEIVRDHMEPVVKLAVDTFLLSSNAVAKKEYFESLIALHQSWTQPALRFRDGG